MKRHFFLYLLALLITTACQKQAPIDATSIQPIQLNNSQLFHGKPLSPYFLGLSHEWGQAQLLMGNPSGVMNPLYLDLLEPLADANHPLTIRIGGSSSDTREAFSPAELESLNGFYRAAAQRGIPVRFVLGINFIQFNPELACTQIAQLTQALPFQALYAIELGNQPDVYTSHYLTRPKNWNFDAFLKETQRRIATLAACSAYPVKIAGPNMAGFPNHPWLRNVSPTSFGTVSDIANYAQAIDSQLAYIGQHHYATVGSGCGERIASGVLLSEKAAGAGPNLIIPYLKLAEAYSLPYRISEMNSVLCYGEDGISNAYESVLWFLDTSSTYAYLGVEGIQLHMNNWNATTGWDTYGAFTFDVPEQQLELVSTIPPPAGCKRPTAYELHEINPVYYGLRIWREITLNTSHIAPLRLSDEANVKGWRFSNPETGREKWMILNKSDKTIALNLQHPLSSHAQVTRLTAPSIDEKKAILWGEQTFDKSKKGEWIGTKKSETWPKGAQQLRIIPYQMALIDYYQAP